MEASAELWSGVNKIGSLGELDTYATSQLPYSRAVSIRYLQVWVSIFLQVNRDMEGVMYNGGEES